METKSGIFIKIWGLSVKPVINFLLPARCVVTGEIVESSEMLSPDAWSQLNFISDPMCNTCGIPFSVSDMDEEIENMLCATCLDNPPAYKKLRTSLVYDDVSRGLLLGFKHGDKTHLALPFSSWMSKSGAIILNDSDMIVPVPLHWTRLIKRRYNQAGLIAQCVSKKLDIPVNTTQLIRIKRTKSQGYMKKAERIKNINKAFAVTDKGKLLFKDKNIVLIDDVYTTGVTINECAQILLDSGAKSVQALCVARTVYS